MTVVEAIAIARVVLQATIDEIHAAARRGKGAHIDALPLQASEEVLCDLQRIIEDKPRDLY